MGRRHWTVIALVLAVVAALGTLSVAVAQSQSTTLTMASQNNSGITGTATLTEIGGGKVRVEIKATGAGAGPQPAHIHEGTCAQLNPAPKFPLSPVANGTSTSEISTSLEQLMSVPHAIHMHKSPEEIPIYVACADVKS